MVMILSFSGVSSIFLSVLALSSRFDGPNTQLRGRIPAELFQYSLCRVVLMVDSLSSSASSSGRLSVLALSSRFDGHMRAMRLIQASHSFSTRSVESF